MECGIFVVLIGEHPDYPREHWDQDAFLGLFKSAWQCGDPTKSSWRLLRRSEQRAKPWLFAVFLSETKYYPVKIEFIIFTMR